jgi:arsenate reductase
MAVEKGMPILVEVLVSEGCPHAGETIALVKGIVHRLAPDAPMVLVCVDTPEKAATPGFLGSPSVRVNGEDIERIGAGRSALCCRTYSGEGVPPTWMVEAAILRAVKPEGLLFLCVANSARSQMAEGIARALAPAHTGIWSAGSRPTCVRPEAVAVLSEIGIDISGHRSKAVSEVPQDRIDTVITLCDQDECPILPGRARRLHWGLPDPGAVVGSEEDRLSAFRRTRDELRRRIGAVFACGSGLEHHGLALREPGKASADAAVPGNR